MIGVTVIASNQKKKKKNQLKVKKTKKGKKVQKYKVQSTKVQRYKITKGIGSNPWQSTGEKKFDKPCISLSNLLIYKYKHLTQASQA